MRLQFWLEYERIQDTGRFPSEMEINLSYVVGFAMSKESFYKYWLTENTSLAWLLCPPVEYKAALEEALRESMVKLRSCLDFDLMKADGELNLKALQWLLRADEHIFKRLKGMEKLPGQVPKIEKPVKETKQVEPPPPEVTEPQGPTAEELLKAELAEIARLKEEKKAREKAKAREVSGV